MSELPDRYGASNGRKLAPEDRIVTNNFVVSIGILAMACGVAVMGMSLRLLTQDFYSFASYSLNVLSQTAFVALVAYTTLIIGFLAIIVGALLGISGLYTKSCKTLFPVSLFLLFICAGLHIAAGAVVQSQIAALNAAIYNQGKTPPAVGSFTSNVTHFQLAMFNACCASQGYTAEIFDPDDPSILAEDRVTDGVVRFCDSLYKDNIKEIEVEGQRTCFHDQETYRQMNHTVARNQQRICATLTDAEVDVTGKDIPGTTIKVTTFTRGVARIPIVDNIVSPIYGCGIGFAKAFQAATLIWIENTFSPIATAFIACGVVELFLLVLAFVTHYSCSFTSETAEEKYARYMEELANSSKSGQVVNIAELEGSAGNPSARFSVQNPQVMNASNRLSVQSAATSGSALRNYQDVPIAEITFNVDDKI